MVSLLKILRLLESALLMGGTALALLIAAIPFALAYGVTHLHDWLARGTRYERGLLGDFEQEPNMLASFFGIGRKHEFQKRLEARKPIAPGLMEAIRQEQELQYVPKNQRPERSLQ